MVMVKELSIRHLVLFKEEDITFASCRDKESGRVRNFALYNHKGAVKEYRRKSWNIVSQDFARFLRDRIETALIFSSVPVIQANYRFEEAFYA